MFDFDKLLDGVFSKSSHEYEVLELTYQVIVSSAPTTSAEIKNHITILDQQRVELSTLYYLLSRNITRYKTNMQKETDPAYTRLVKLGRPSKDAIEAELRSTNETYATSILKIEELTQVRDLVSSYIRSVDSRKQSMIEMLKNSYRLD